jgi:hypothetical protein
MDGKTQFAISIGVILMMLILGTGIALWSLCFMASQPWWHIGLYIIVVSLYVVSLPFIIITKEIGRRIIVCLCMLITVFMAGYVVYALISDIRDIIKYSFWGEFGLYAIFLIVPILPLYFFSRPKVKEFFK